MPVSNVGYIPNALEDPIYGVRRMVSIEIECIPGCLWAAVQIADLRVTLHGCAAAL